MEIAVLANLLELARKYNLITTSACTITNSTIFFFFFLYISEYSYSHNKMITVRIMR